MSVIDIVRENFKARTDIQGELRQIDEAATTDKRDYTDDERSTIDEKRTALAAIDERIQVNLEQETRSAQIQDGLDRFLGVVADRDSGEVTDSRSIGQRFVDTDEYRSFASRAGQGSTGALNMQFDGMDFRAVTDTTLGATSGGSLARPALQSRIGLDFLDRKVYLLDLLPHIATTDTAVVYVQDKSPLADMPNKAAETTEGAAKPQAGITTAVVTEPIATIAAWVNLTRQVSADVPQLQGYLDNRLRYSVKRRADAEVIGGNGTPPNLTGLSNRAGILTYAPGAAEARYVTIRHSIRVMEDNEAVPEIVVLNPADAEIFDLSNSATAGIHAAPDASGGLTQSPSRTAWGLTQVHSTAIAAGTALLVDPMATTVFDRQQPTAYLTDSHASNFISNILTLLLEARLGLALFNPLGVLKVTFNGTV